MKRSQRWSVGMVAECDKRSKRLSKEQGVID